jgi:hypothetical protein
MRDDDVEGAQAPKPAGDLLRPEPLSDEVLPGPGAEVAQSVDLETGRYGEGPGTGGEGQDDVHIVAALG